MHPARRAAQRPGDDHARRGRRRGRGASRRTRRSGRGPGSSRPRWPRSSGPKEFAIATKTDLASPSRSPPPAGHPGAGRRDRRRGPRLSGLGRRRRPGVAAAGPAGRAAPGRSAALPDGDLTDAPEEILVVELVREAALEGLRDELRTRGGGGGGDATARGPPRGQAAARHPRQPVRRARLPEGHHHRPEGCARRDIGTRARQQIVALRISPSTSTCTSRSPRTGSATPPARGKARLLTHPPTRRFLRRFSAACRRRIDGSLRRTPYAGQRTVDLDADTAKTPRDVTGRRSGWAQRPAGAGRRLLVGGGHACSPSGSRGGRRRRRGRRPRRGSGRSRTARERRRRAGGQVDDARAPVEWPAEQGTRREVAALGAAVPHMPHRSRALGLAQDALQRAGHGGQSLRPRRGLLAAR